MDMIKFGHKYLFGKEKEPLVPIKFEVFHVPEFKIEITCFTVKQYKQYEKHMLVADISHKDMSYRTVAQKQGVKMPKPRIVTLTDGDQIKEVLS